MVIPTVFECFPNAIVSKVWVIGQFAQGTMTGNVFNPLRYVDVIIDEGSNTQIDNAPNAQTMLSDTLLYARPEQMPVTSSKALTSDYMLYNEEEDTYYAIIDAGIGKNQETGVVEHIELKIRETEASNYAPQCQNHA